MQCQNTKPYLDLTATEQRVIQRQRSLHGVLIGEFDVGKSKNTDADITNRMIRVE